MKLAATLLAVLSLLAAGCGGDSDDDGAAPPAAGVPAPGGGLSVEEAIASDLDGPLMVKGFYVDSGDEARLCTALLESHPPQCGQPSLRLEGPVDEVELEQASGVRWSDEQISVLGELEDDVLAVSATAR